MKFSEEIKYISHKERRNQGQYTQILSEGTAEPALVKHTLHKRKQQSKHTQLPQKGREKQREGNVWKKSEEASLEENILPQVGEKLSPRS